MTDNLDHALQNLPSEPYPETLTELILVRLRKDRHRKWVLSRISWFGAGLSTALSVRILSEWWSWTDLAVPVFSFPTVLNWFQSIGSSPYQTVIENTIALLDWMGLMAISLGGSGLRARAPAFPGILAMSKLLFESDMDEVLWV